VGYRVRHLAVRCTTQASRAGLPVAPASVYDALSGQALDWRLNDAGQVVIDVPDLHIHRAIVLSVG
jgi:hypothetical protein